MSEKPPVAMAALARERPRRKTPHNKIPASIAMSKDANGILKGQASPSASLGTGSAQHEPLFFTSTSHGERPPDPYRIGTGGYQLPAHHSS